MIKIPCWDITISPSNNFILEIHISIVSLAKHAGVMPLSLPFIYLNLLKLAFELLVYHHPNDSYWYHCSLCPNEIFLVYTIVFPQNYSFISFLLIRQGVDTKISKLEPFELYQISILCRWNTFFCLAFLHSRSFSITSISSVINP